jgi:hypothetical protein
MKKLYSNIILSLIFMLALTPTGAWGFNGGQFAVPFDIGFGYGQDNPLSLNQIWPALDSRLTETDNSVEAEGLFKRQDRNLLIAGLQTTLTSGVWEKRETTWSSGPSIAAELAYQPVTRDQGSMVTMVGDFILPTNNIVEVIPEQVASTPEPATLLLFGSGLAAGALARVRRKK